MPTRACGVGQGLLTEPVDGYIQECEDMGSYAELNGVIAWAHSGTLAQVRPSHGCATAVVGAPRRQLQCSRLPSWKATSHVSMAHVTSNHSYNMNVNGLLVDTKKEVEDDDDNDDDSRNNTFRWG